MSLLMTLGLFLPLAGFIILVALADKLTHWYSGLIACSTVVGAFLSFTILLVAFLSKGMESEVTTLFHWIPIQGISSDFSLHFDAVSLLMCLIITGVGSLIHVYSLGYMDHEEDSARYFACLNFFVFSMLLLVLAADIVVLFVGWEGVGLASYLLIGFWYYRPAAAQAATKAFVMNRIGDLGLLLGILLTLSLFGTGNIEEINRRAVQEFVPGVGVMTWLTLLYFIGATGKSAQLPLYSWLPDAMEGPTPVSALIHAATMVTAGVYLIIRMHPLFLLAPTTLQIVGMVGAATSLFAALSAAGQTDLKKVLAYSTVSQLGLMFLACGAGAFYAAMFHLTSHAFIKALLFLSAGNVVHMMQGETRMDKMGGLSSLFGKTRWLFLIGVLALAGIPPFAAFFSKGLILEQEHLAGYNVLFYLGWAASILTGFYLIRAYCLTFMGDSQLDSKMKRTVKEAPHVMLIPVAILALLATLGGLLGYPIQGVPLLESFLKEIGLTPVEAELRSGFILTTETWVTLGVSLLVMSVSVWLYTKSANRYRSVSWLENAFYVDEAYNYLVVLPLRYVSKWVAQVLEWRLFDGMVQGAVLAVMDVSQGMQKWQNGQIRSYLAWMLVGSALLIVYLVY